jgi:hypothetical protein
LLQRSSPGDYVSPRKRGNVRHKGRKVEVQVKVEENVRRETKEKRLRLRLRLRKRGNVRHEMKSRYFSPSGARDAPPPRCFGPTEVRVHKVHGLLSLFFSKKGSFTSNRAGKEDKRIRSENRKEAFHLTCCFRKD